MRRISLLLVSLIMWAAQTALAQSFSVKGTIISSEDNEPLIGATILQEGTTNGVATDVDGNFTTGRTHQNAFASKSFDR